MKKSLLLILIMSIALYADYTMVIQIGDKGEQQTVQYKDDKHVRISMDANSGMMIIEDKAYIVETKDGETTVIDMDEMRAMMGGMTAGMKERAEVAKHEMDIKIIKKGKKRTIAGIKGQVWTVQYKEDGKIRQSDIVVTDDKRVVKAMNAYGKAISRIAMNDEESDDEFMTMMQIEPGYVMIASEQEDDGGRFELQKFSEKSIAASIFVLPANAKKQEMPDFAGLFGGGQKSSGDATQKGILSDCYDKVCCGSTDGDAKVLTPMLKPSEDGYKLHGTPSVCNALGISSFFGSSDVEGALYKKGKEDYIQITLNLNDSGEGAVRTSQKQVKAGVSLVKAVKDYKQGSFGSVKYYYGYLEPMRQQTLDIMLDSEVILSVTRTAKHKIDLIDWAEDAIDIDAYRSAEEEQAGNDENQESAFDADKAVEGVGEAMDAIMNLF